MRVFQPGLKAEMSILDIRILYSDTENAPLPILGKYNQKPCLGQERIAHEEWKDKEGVWQPDLKAGGQFWERHLGAGRNVGLVGK